MVYGSVAWGLVKALLIGTMSMSFMILALTIGIGRDQIGTRRPRVGLSAAAMTGECSAVVDRVALSAQPKMQRAATVVAKLRTHWVSMFTEAANWKHGRFFSKPGAARHQGRLFRASDCPAGA